MRHMENTFEGFTFYRSSFDPETGALVRQTEQPEPGHDGWEKLLTRGLSWEIRGPIREAWRRRFDWRGEPFSPVPETLDVAITNWCNFGCSYCYQDSTAADAHAPADHLERVIRSFRQPPYQVAIGGGEPTAHPDLPAMLYRARELGVVPNYTTAGHIFRAEVIEATNEVGGGVAMTFHAHRGADWFVEHYARLRKALRVQLNVHLIADKDAPRNLDALVEAQKRTGALNLVLLAYYPDVGRGSPLGIIQKHTYNVTLPAAIRRAIESGTRVAFSEGLLPYFISRTEIGVETRQRLGRTESVACRAEGLFSAYVDMYGRMSRSSFDPPPRPTERDFQVYARSERESRWHEGDERELRRRYAERVARWSSAYDGEGVLQRQWDLGFRDARAPHHLRCKNCAEQPRCATPSPHHYFICAYSEVNGGTPPVPPRLAAERELGVLWREACDAADAQEAALGRPLAAAERDPIFAAWAEAERRHTVTFRDEGDEREPLVHLSRRWLRALECIRHARNKSPRGRREKMRKIKERRRALGQWRRRHPWISEHQKAARAQRRKS